MPFVKHSDVADGGNGVASNCHDFVKNKLIPFITSSTHFPAAADRWTLERTDIVATNEEELFISAPTNAPNAPAVAWHTRDQAAFMFAGTSYAAGVEAYALPGNTRQFPGSAGDTNPIWDPTDATNKDRQNCSWTNVWPTAGLSAHWLFAPSDGKYCYAIIQLSSREFRHILFGQYTKFASAMTGGQFFGAHYWSQSVAEIDDPYNSNREHSGAIIAQSTSLGGGVQTGAYRALGLRTGATIADAAEWHFNGRGFSSGASHNPHDGQLRPTSGTWDTANNTAIETGRVWCDALGDGNPGSTLLFQVQQSLIANVKALLPLTIWCLGFAEGQDRYMPVGQMPDIFRIHMSGFTPGQNLVVGSGTYSLFPIVNSDQVNTLSNEPYSGFDGVAILQRA